jgi:hypothetical protein
MARKSAVKKSEKIVALAGDKNMDYFFDETTKKANTVYFREARGYVLLGTANSDRPEFRLKEVNKYVLGVYYIWVKKN